MGLHCAPSAHRDALGTYPTGTIRFSFGWWNTGGRGGTQPAGAGAAAGRSWAAMELKQLAVLSDGVGIPQLHQSGGKALHSQPTISTHIRQLEEEPIPA